MPSLVYSEIRNKSYLTQNTTVFKGLILNFQLTFLNAQKLC